LFLENWIARKSETRMNSYSSEYESYKETSK
jgi:hypothetical protein